MRHRGIVAGTLALAVGSFALGCACGAPTNAATDAGPTDATPSVDAASVDSGRDASSPRCWDGGTCAAPPVTLLAPGAPTSLPAAFYQANGAYGCLTVLFREETDGVVIETHAQGIGHSLVPPAEFTCDAASETCVLRGAPSGRYIFGASTCSLSRGCYAVGDIDIDLDVERQLVNLGYLGGWTSGCPNDVCSCF